MPQPTHAPDGSWTVVDGVLTVDAHDIVRLCHDPSGQPCPPDAPQVAGIDPRHAAAGLPDALVAGRLFARVDGGDFTDLVILSRSHQPVAVFSGDPPADPIPAGTYELTLVNYGDLAHTLVNDDLDVALDTDPAASNTTDSTLLPGSDSFYCGIPGHREHMTVTLDVE